MKHILILLLTIIAINAHAQNYKTDSYAWMLGNSIASNIAANQRAATGNNNQSYTYTPPQVYNQPETFYYPPYTYTVQPKTPVPQIDYTRPVLPTLQNQQSALPKYPEIAPIYIQN